MNTLHPGRRMRGLTASLVLGLACGAAPLARAQDAATAATPTGAVAPIWRMAGEEREPLMDTLRSLVEIETGSAHRPGLDQLSARLAERLRALGGEVRIIEPQADDVYRMEDTPSPASAIGRMVQATFRGTGQKKILLIAHMDTVYPVGMLAQQPFRIEGNRAYGLGISDDKQGLATILHTVAMLQRLGVHDYGTLTVLFNGDEEISSPASRGQLARLGAAHDVVLSFEASRADSDKVSLATSGIAMATLTVKGRASHAGGAPEQGVNALYELSHQLLQLRDLSVPERGLKVNWTIARAGVVRNMIPPSAEASADIRLLHAEDLASVEKILRERTANRLLPAAEVSVRVENRRPPLEPTPAARAVAAHAQGIYREIDRALVVDDQPEGGGTDAAFAASQTRAAVLERLGLRGFGAHSNQSEYILVDSIQPRLYLTTRLIMDLASGKAP